MNKRGITLITVVLAVVILAMLAGSVIFNASGMIKKTKIAKFAEEIELIEDKIEEYYLLNGEYPILNTTTYSAEQIVALNSLGKGMELNNEITANKDEENVFFMIDFLKIGINLEERGQLKTSDDMFVCSKYNNNVYYIKGLEAENNIYFSLINISDMNKIN